MKEQKIIVVKTKDFPILFEVLGVDGVVRKYDMIPTRKGKGAQLCKAN